MSNGTTTSIDVAEVLAVDENVARSTGSQGFGLTPRGFVPKPFARLLAEKLTLARALFGEDLDLTSGSAIRKLLEVSALEDGRTWASLAAMYDNCFVTSATGEALSRLGDELGLPRPFLPATGTIKVTLAGELPPAHAEGISIPRGARLLTPGGHHVATDKSFVLSQDTPEREVPVSAFYPGASHNLDPSVPDDDGNFPQRIDRWHPQDHSLQTLFDAEDLAGAKLTQIEHAAPFTGGELQWPDARYRQLLLQAPRSVWTVDAIRIAVSLVPGVRQIQVRDGWGGLDISQSIFGNFNFVERVFGSERDLGSPYYFTVLVAPTPAAIWDGPDGLRASIESAIEDLRPVSIFPRVEEADEIAVGVEAGLVVSGIPLPAGSRATVNNSDAARALKQRLLVRLRRYIDGLKFGEPVRSAEVTWAIMNEPGVEDVRDLNLVRFPTGFEAIDFGSDEDVEDVERFDCGKNIDVQINQIALFVDDDSGLKIV